MSEVSRSCNLVINSDSEEISVSGLTSEDLTIGYGKDIDLTDLVVGFAKLIDTGETVSLEIPDDIEGEKLAMVLATIKDITDAYNSSLKTSEADIEEEVIDMPDFEDDEPPF